MGLTREQYTARVREGRCIHCTSPAEPHPRGGFYSACRKHRAYQVLFMRARRPAATVHRRCRKCRRFGHRAPACDIRKEDLRG